MDLSGFSLCSAWGRDDKWGIRVPGRQPGAHGWCDNQFMEDFCGDGAGQQLALILIGWYDVPPRDGSPNPVQPWQPFGYQSTRSTSCFCPMIIMSMNTTLCHTWHEAADVIFVKNTLDLTLKPSLISVCKSSEILIRGGWHRVDSVQHTLISALLVSTKH